MPESGKILIDGVDIATTDPSWLRRQIGVVLQENFLFNASVRDNIAVHAPSHVQVVVLKVVAAGGPVRLDEICVALVHAGEHDRLVRSCVVQHDILNRMTWWPWL